METNQAHAILGRIVAGMILDSIRPYWYQDPEATIQRQGNWPVDAQFGVVARIHNRGMSNRDCGEVKFFPSKEALDAYMAEAKEFYPGSDFSFSAMVYTWDWGPQFMTSVVLN